MFGLILLIVLVGIVVGGIVIGCFVVDNNEDVGVMFGLTAFVALIFFLLPLSITWSILYMGSKGEIASLQAFYEDTISSYEYSITATGQVDIVNAEVGLIDVAYLEQGKTQSERIREFRDKIDWYNGKLRHYEVFNGMWVADPFLADVPEELKPIRLGE